MRCAAKSSGHGQNRHIESATAPILSKNAKNNNMKGQNVYIQELLRQWLSRLTRENNH